MLHDEDAALSIPSSCDIEVASAVRGYLLLGVLSAPRAEELLTDYLALPLHRHGHEGLLGRVLQLRHNFSAYDAAYVALAESLGAGLLTVDVPLARAVSTFTGVTVIS